MWTGQVAVLLVEGAMVPPWIQKWMERTGGKEVWVGFTRIGHRRYRYLGLRNGAVQFAKTGALLIRSPYSMEYLTAFGPRDALEIRQMWTKKVLEANRFRCPSCRSNSGRVTSSSKGRFIKGLTYITHECPRCQKAWRWRDRMEDE